MRVIGASEFGRKEIRTVTTAILGEGQYCQ